MTTPTTRETWTYAAGALYTPRSIFKKPEPAPQPESVQKPPTVPDYVITPQRFMTEDEFIELRTAIVTALLPYPEARNAVAESRAACQNNPPG
jgi:hypothetical protein